MASVIASVVGGDPMRLEVETVGEALDCLGLEGNYTGTVNGEPASLETELYDEDFVSFSQAVKGG